MLTSKLFHGITIWTDPNELVGAFHPNDGPGTPVYVIGPGKERYRVPVATQPNSMWAALGKHTLDAGQMP